MTCTYRLEPRTIHDRPLVFTWNPEAGTFEGPDGAYVAKLANEYAERGTVTSHPYPTTYPCTDPWHNPTHLTVILGHYWRLPAELAEALPVSPDSGEGEIRVIY